METSIPNYSIAPRRKFCRTPVLVAVIILLGILTLVQAGILLKLRSEAGTWPWRSSSTAKLSSASPGQSDKPIIFWEAADDLTHIHAEINKLLRQMTRDFPSPLAGGPFPGITMPQETSSTKWPFGASTPAPRDDDAPNGSRPPVRSSWHDFNELQQEIERIFEDAYTEIRQNSLLSRVNRGWDLVPAVAAMNVEDQGRNYLLTIALPGYTKQDITLSLEGRRLSVAAALAPAPAPESSQVFTVRQGQFHTAITLPDNIEGAGIQAQYEHDILRVIIPKAVSTNTLVKTIAIR